MQTQQNGQLMTADQIARRCQVSRATVLRWHRKGQLPPAVKLTQRSLRWFESDICGWLEDGERLNTT